MTPHELVGARIGVDATSWHNRRGYGRFARNAVTRLVERDPANTYVLLMDTDSAEAGEVPASAETHSVALARPPSEAAAAGSSRPLLDILRLTRAARGQGLDAFVFPSVYTYFPVVGTPVLLGVHDAIAEEHPELTLPDRRARAFWRAKRALAIRNAARIFTVSEASRAVLEQRFGLHDVAVVPEAPDPVFRPRGERDAQAALAAVGVEFGAFFVYAGGISPHKNLPALLDGYGRLRETRPEAPPLVLVGDLESDPYMSAAEAVRERIATLGLEAHVVLPGFVSDDTLAGLYSAATAAVLPSLAEGFGLPAVEAAACGAATVLSDLPAHRETLGDAALYFPPTDAARLAEQLGRLLGDGALRDRLREHARVHVAALSWDLAADRLRELVTDTAATRPTGRSRARPAASRSGELSAGR
jgi:glycosyltransferase involved in cell wall biosynthesis